MVDCRNEWFVTLFCIVQNCGRIMIFIKQNKNSDSQFIQNRAALYDNLKMLVMSYLQINTKKSLKKLCHKWFIN